ncbi:HTH-type transcriptional regulator BenM [bioreactor metagenome]|uniref:HTH-type transcriptional regulator BenM n=1 Tax=bioreactor metagenome TaxID=1076179 RepID=A0A645A8Z2_9ZZZZ
MDIKQLQCFVAVAEDLNFTSAAQRLYLSQPSLSRRIQELEKELGLLLFIRNKKNVSLSAAGIYFLTTAKELISLNNNILFTAKCLNDGMLGRIKIGYQGSARSIIPPYLNTFNKKYPDVLISIEQQGADLLLQAVMEGKIDIAFAFSVIREGSPYNSGFMSKILNVDTMSVFMSLEQTRKYKEGKKICFEDLAEESFIQIDRTINPGYFEVLHKLYLKNNFYPKRIIETRLFDTLMLLVESGMGVSLLPQQSTVPYNKNVGYVDLVYPDAVLPVEAIWKTKNVNPCLPLLLKEL